MATNAQTVSSTRLSKALRSVRGTLLATVLFSFFINLLMLVGPIYMLQVYDRVLGSRNETTLVMLTIIAAGLLVVFGLLEMIRQRVLVRVGCKLDGQLNHSIFRSAFEQAVTRPGAGQSQSLRDLDSLREFMTGPGLIACCDAPWLPLFLAVVFLFHPLLGLVALAGALVIGILAVLNELTTRKPLMEASSTNVDANSFVSNSLRNAEVVSAMGMLPGVMRRWSQRHGDVIGLQAQASDRAGAISSSSKAIRLFLQVAMLGVGAHLVLQEAITPGTMIAASIIMGRALAPVEAAVGQWRSLVNARTAYKRLTRLLAATGEDRERMPLPAPTGRLSAERAVIAPPGSSTPVIKGISFELPAGEAMGIVGASGAGKSTLARALVGVWPAQRGAVRLDGADIADWDKEQLGPYIGYLPQDVELFDGTVAENIARFREVDSDAVVRAAQMAGVHELILSLPQGYDTEIGVGGQALSGGQRQRVALARALYGDVRLILLDEPNANLDTDGEAALTDTIARLRGEGRTVVLITHRRQLLAGVDKLLVLADGQATAFGPPADVMARLRAAAGQTGRGDQAASGSGDGRSGNKTGASVSASTVTPMHAAVDETARAAGRSAPGNAADPGSSGADAVSDGPQPARDDDGAGDSAGDPGTPGPSAHQGETDAAPGQQQRKGTRRGV